VPDPIRAPIVRMIFEDYCLHGLGLGALCNKLNRHLERHPPPARNKKDENDLPQTWSRSQLQAMLRNPKYTGYKVWGRHDNPPGRLDLLRDELARTAADGWHEHEAETTNRRRELAELERSLYRQALRLEEHDDPGHPVIALAKRRIVELTARRDQLERELTAL